MTIHTRVLGACALACGLTMATMAPAQTDWNSLKSGDWGNKSSSSQSGDEQNQADAKQTKQNQVGANQTENSAAGKQDGASTGGSGAGISQAFVKLGMAQARADCYENVLTQKLSPQDQRQAAQLIKQSSDADEVKTNVITAGPTMVGGFSAADASCPDGMGS